MAIAPRDGIEAAVFEVFRELLDRVPTPAERAEWTGKLSRGVSVKELRTLLENSVEHVTPANDAWTGIRYPDVDAAGLSPIRHYVEHGALEKAAGPIPGSIRLWYRVTYRLAAHEDPLFHYVSIGEASGFDHPPNSTRPGIAPTTIPRPGDRRWRTSYRGGVTVRWRPVPRCGRRWGFRSRA